jgi:uncharacterized protein
MRSPIGALIFVAVMLLLDLYVFAAIKTVTAGSSARAKTIVNTVFWSISIAAIIVYLIFIFTQQDLLGRKLRTYLFSTVIGIFIAKVIAVAFFMVDDVRRILQWVFCKVFSKDTEVEEMAAGITRSTFLSWLGLAAGGGIFATLLYGYSNKYKYTVRNVPVTLPNLPAAFKGLKIVQISDVHSGSFTNKQAVEKGIDKILALKPDVIFFTGDLVNDKATEMADYTDTFARLKAPVGVYSILGNHDYGDYVPWPDRDGAHREKEKQANQHLLTPIQQQNLNDLIQVHAKMGWRLLLDEHVALKKDNQEIGLIGVQNISGKGRFHSYGSLAKAYAGAEKYPTKILLSHDPSHWDKEVITQYPDIALTLSGHTHGMQFGVEIPGFKWSPVQYVYNRWSDLHQVGAQKLYVNRGFGFIGYPGRVGILPEITLFTLS